MSQMTYNESHIESSDDENTNDRTIRCDFENFKKWPAAAAQLLINLRLSLDDKFSSGYVMKKTLWKKISQILIENGFDFNSAACEAKFKGIKLTYKRNIKKLKENPEAEIIWPYFKLLHEHYDQNEYKLGDETDNSGCKDFCEEVSGNETGGIHIKWPYTAIELLLTFRLSMEHDFQCAYRSKKSLWNKISTELNKQGFLYSGEACATKFKGLLVTYKRNLKNSEELGKEIVWPYFNKLHAIFGSNEKTLTKYISQNNEIPSKLNSTNEVDDEPLLHISDNEETKIWNAVATRLLIKKRGEMQNEFITGRCSKKELWTELADSLKVHGIETDGEACREKFKGLVLTYRRNLEKYFANNKKNITWPLFKLMHQTFGNKKLQSKKIYKSSINEESCFQENSNDSLSLADINEFVNSKNFSDHSESEDCCKKEQWNIESVFRLIKIRLKLKENFDSSPISEASLWEDISKKMKQHDMHFSKEDCQIKFQSVFKTFCLFKTQSILIENKDTWPFFDLMEQIFPGNSYQLDYKNLVDLQNENQKIVKEKLKSHLLMEMFHSSSSEYESFSENENKINLPHKKRHYIKWKLRQKRMKLEEKRNELLERKIVATERKNAVIFEFVNILKQHKNLI
ncbi:uncharacterized protein LOC129616203 [Condylostylus longicornis]|uniref:uncharacterized protein LOC129616203 n=1 Tax=Condylostylus longicornis TaxID=2530218 RepID=UPI00244E3FCC|nr:uncharacterized protein LOC129616203 [Condylostylus longicornis]